MSQGDILSLLHAEKGKKFTANEIAQRLRIRNKTVLQKNLNRMRKHNCVYFEQKTIPKVPRKVYIYYMKGEKDE